MEKRGRKSIPPDDQRCVATSKQHNRRCRNYRDLGTTVCRFHGAAMQVQQQQYRLDNGQGRSSMRLPIRLAERYDQLVSDPEILNLSRDLALLDIRLEELTGRLEDGESTRGWARAKEAFRKLRAALTDGNGGAVREQIGVLGRLIDSSVNLDNTWRDIRDILLERRLLAETERRRLVDLHQMVTVEELMLLMNNVVMVINKHVPEPERRANIAIELRALLNREAATRSGRPARPRPDDARVVDAQVTVVGRQNGTG
jgi:hypothetical protein